MSIFARFPPRLQEAIVAHTAALQVQSRARDPWSWGASHHNLGNALRGLGRLDEAIASFHKALAVRLVLEHFEGVGLTQMLVEVFGTNV